ncbi:GtrA family protein [Pseudooceanicola sp. LIPI14-2-Ac024]|uniref:GtrA family protein n=1 Tax=Pseudooceanicola sp. LIPI14-2-Ac024 TaxID=3344875 RepID=UPI0035D11997
MTLAGLTLRYALFAVAATVVNLATQRLVLSLDDGPYGFALAVLTGTLAGLVLKYVLDKRWIFFDRSAGMATHGRKFTLYTVMGLVTTAIFWGTETAFWLIWGTDLAREGGAVLGLTIGYIVKFNLDRRFVFTDSDLVIRPTTAP